MRRVTAAVSVTLLLLVATAVAEASLLGLLLLFAWVLRLYLVVELAGEYMQFSPLKEPSVMQVAIANAGTGGSFLIMLAGGVGAAVHRYRRWTPAP